MKGITTIDKIHGANSIDEQQEYSIIKIPEIDNQRNNKTLFDRVKNLFFYNWLYIVMIVVFVVLASILAKGVIAQQKPDITVVVLSSKNQIYDYKDKLQKVFEKSIDDVNGDGEKVVKISLIPVNDETKEIAMAAQTKLFTQLSGGNNMIIISDEDCDEVINSAVVFKNLEAFYPINANIDDYKFKLKSTNLSQMLGWDNMPDDLYIAITSYDEGMAVTKEKAKKQFEIAKREFNNFVIYIT